MAKTNAELVGLQQEKEDIEDKNHCLVMELSADRERIQGLMVQLSLTLLMTDLHIGVNAYKVSVQNVHCIKIHKNICIVKNC